jgi:hypothetical protein
MLACGHWDHQGIPPATVKAAHRILRAVGAHPTFSGEYEF